ncbi:SapB/AmfS family lanthipeptide [Streptomyces sp. 796.1]
MSLLDLQMLESDDVLSGHGGDESTASLLLCDSNVSLLLCL